MGFRSGALERGQTRSVGLDSRRAPREPNLHRDGGTGHAPWRPGGPMGWLSRPSVARRSSPASRARPRGRRGGSWSILTDFRSGIAVCSHARRATDRRRLHSPREGRPRRIRPPSPPSATDSSALSEVILAQSARHHETRLGDVGPTPAPPPRPMTSLPPSRALGRSVE